MAFPPSLPPGDRANDTVSSVNHPGDHNALVAALQEWALECGDDLKGASATLTARLEQIEATALQSVETGDIADLAVTTAKLAAGAVTGAKITNNTITSAQIGPAAVNTSELVDDAVTGAKIASNTITAGNIAANAVTGSELAANAVTGAHIAANTITAGDIAANAIGYSELGSKAVGNVNMADGMTIRFGTGSSANPSIRFHADDNTGFYSDPNTGIIATVNGTPRYFMNNTGLFIYAPSGNATSCQIDGLGRLLRYTSAERYKTDITPVSDDVLCQIGDTIEAVTYSPNPETTDADHDKVFLGAIAERVEELLPPEQLDWFIVYDTEGRCESLKYQLFGLVAIAMSRRNQKRMDALEARIETLEES